MSKIYAHAESIRCISVESLKIRCYMVPYLSSVALILYSVAGNIMNPYFRLLQKCIIVKSGKYDDVHRVFRNPVYSVFSKVV